MCSLYQIYVESSLLAFEGATSELPVGPSVRGGGVRVTQITREMFRLMYFPVGRKTHVVAFNLIRVTLRRRVVRTKCLVLFFEVFYFGYKCWC